MKYFYVTQEHVKGLSLDEKKELMNTYDDNVHKSINYVEFN